MPNQRNLITLIGNFDRHKDNFGYLVSPSTGTIKLAPVYDCGSCLYPSLASDGMLKVLSDREEIETRMYMFPKAALNMSDDIKHETKASYYDMISSGYDKNCTKAFLKIYPRINMDKIHSIIDNAPYIPDSKKHFYNSMLNYRKELILDKAYSILTKDKTKSTKKSISKDYFSAEAIVKRANAGSYMDTTEKTNAPKKPGE